MDGCSSVIGLIRSKLLKKPVAGEEASERLKTPLMDCIENIIECAVDYRYMYCRYGRGVACMYTVIVQVRSPFMYILFMWCCDFLFTFWQTRSLITCFVG